MLVVLGAFELWSTGMFGILAWLRKICVSGLEHRILIPMSELALQAQIAGNLMIFGFHCALHEVLIQFSLWHESTFG